MPVRATNRLLVVGPSAALESFSQSDWEPLIGARHVEVLECAVTRAGWQFETRNGPPLEIPAELSKRGPSLTLLLTYEQEEAFTMGLAKMKTGSLTHYQVRY